MKRRYKLLIGSIITGIILVLIFFMTRDKKIYYVSLGDSLAVGKTSYNTIAKSYGDYVSSYLDDKGILEFYTKDFAKEGYRSVDVLNDIKENTEIVINDKRISIKHALIKADLVTVSIGMNDLFYKLNLGNKFKKETFDDIYAYVDEVMLDIDKMLYELRKSCKEEIMVFGFYNPFINYSPKLSTNIEPMILYANNKMKLLVNKYNMTYIDIHNSFLANEEYLSSKFEIHPTEIGYKAMSKHIINLIDKKMLAK